MRLPKCCSDFKISGRGAINAVIRAVIRPAPISSAPRTWREYRKGILCSTSTLARTPKTENLSVSVSGRN